MHWIRSRCAFHFFTSTVSKPTLRAGPNIRGTAREIREWATAATAQAQRAASGSLPRIIKDGWTVSAPGKVLYGSVPFADEKLLTNQVR